MRQKQTSVKDRVRQATIGEHMYQKLNKEEYKDFLRGKKKLECSSLV